MDKPEIWGYTLSKSVLIEPGGSQGKIYVGSRFKPSVRRENISSGTGAYSCVSDTWGCDHVSCQPGPIVSFVNTVVDNQVIGGELRDDVSYAA